MVYTKKMNLFTNLILLAVIVAFAFLYNNAVTQAITDAAYNDKEILQSYNNEIIGKLIEADSVQDWTEIVEQYEDVIIVIENDDNKTVAKTAGRSWSSLDVKVQMPFEYKGKAYLIKTSVYLLRDYVADTRNVVKFIFIEFLIALSGITLLFFAISKIVLKPYKKLYESIEQYDKTGKLEKTSIRGYAGHIYNRFFSMTQNLEANERNQRRIIASISHDIKTPLTSIMGYAEQLQKDSISEERKKRYLSTVYGKSLEIKDIVNEFDEYLSFDRYRQPDKITISAEELSQRIREDYEKELEDTGVRLTVRNSAPSAFISIDIQKFKRVFGNVIANSLKHFKEGEKLILIDITADKDKVLIDIHDNGKGVEEEKLEIIFEPLYTSDEGRRVAGLGLSICREIVDAHGGIIYAGKSELGGLKISVELMRESGKG